MREVGRRVKDPGALADLGARRQTLTFFQVLYNACFNLHQNRALAFALARDRFKQSKGL